MIKRLPIDWNLARLKNYGAQASRLRPEAYHPATFVPYLITYLQTCADSSQASSLLPLLLVFNSLQYLMGLAARSTEALLRRALNAFRFALRFKLTIADDLTHFILDPAFDPLAFTFDLVFIPHTSPPITIGCSIRDGDDGASTPPPLRGHLIIAISTQCQLATEMPDEKEFDVVKSKSYPKFVQ